MNDFDITLDITEKDSLDDEYKWRLQTKVTEDTHDAVLEFANKYTRGNISGAVRYMITHHMEEHGEYYVSPAKRAWLKILKRQRETKAYLKRVQSLHRTAIELKKRPNREYELEAMELAKELGVTWPIEHILPESQVNDDLQYITGKLELQRNVSNKYNSEELRGYLETLSNDQIIKLMTGNNNSISISPF
jgi:hypothetical protein